MTTRCDEVERLRTALQESENWCYDLSALNYELVQSLTRRGETAACNEIDGLRALNAELLAALQTVEWLLTDGFRESALGEARAAITIAKAKGSC